MTKNIKVIKMPKIANANKRFKKLMAALWELKRDARKRKAK